MANVQKNKLSAWIYVAPLIVIICIFVLYPIIQAITVSFFSWDGITDWKFVGIKNYLITFTKDLYFKEAFINTIVFQIGATFGVIIVGFLLALVIDLKFTGWKVYRVLFFLNYVVAIYISAMIWNKFLEPNGVINQILGFLHLDFLQRPWLASQGSIIFFLILIYIWHDSCLPMLFFLAGLSNIDLNIYEAATIDGASTFQRIFKITIPLLKNVFSIVFILQLISTFNIFALAYLLGPSTLETSMSSVPVLGTLLYFNAFGLDRHGYAGVISVISLLIAVIFGLVYIRISGYGKKN